MNEENYIIEKAGKRNPFQVPDGYFDTFASQLMQSLPEQPVCKPCAKTVRLHSVFYAAASICVLLVCMAVYLLWPASAQTDAVQAQAPVYKESDNASFDEVADYVMLDNQDIYACLADY